MKLLSRVRLFATSWTVAPLSMGFSRQEYWSGLPFPSPRDLPDLGSIPGTGRSLGEGNGYPVQYSGLESSMDRGAWQATVHGVAKSWTWLTRTSIYLSVSCLLYSFMHPGHVGCFYILAIVNRAAVNTGVHVSCWISVFIYFWQIPRCAIPGSYGSSSFNFLRKLHTVP